MSQFVLEFVNIGHTYPYEQSELLSDVSFTLSPRQTLTVLLSAQSGKSTLAKLAIGYMAPTKGRVLYKGEEVSKIKKERNIFFLPETPLLYDNRTVEFNIMQPLVLRHMSKTDARVRAEQLATQYDLPLNERVYNLDGDKKLSLAFARADTRGIDLMVIDDCTMYYDRVCRYIRERECAALFITSKPDFASGNVVVIEDKCTAYTGDIDGAKEYISKCYWPESI